MYIRHFPTILTAIYTLDSNPIYAVLEGEDVFEGYRVNFSKYPYNALMGIYAHIFIREFILENTI